MSAPAHGRAAGCIEVRDLRAVGRHGASDEERAHPQPFSCDIDAWFDASAPAASDALEDTVDYGALAVLVAGVVAETSFALLERLAREVADRVLEAHQAVWRLSVTVRKLRPPVPVDVGSIGVTLVRERQG